MYTNVMTLFQSHPMQIQLKKEHVTWDVFHIHIVTYAEIPKFIDTSKIEHLN